jgi:SAM-dependent methyltransferase
MVEHQFCRVCNGDFYVPALLEYPDSPKSAQGFLDSPQQLDDLVNLKIYQCSCCGIVQHTLPPVTYYRDVIRAVAFSEEMGKYRLQQLSDWLEKYELKEKNIIEVGCGRGEYLDLLALAGAKKLSGIENSPDNVDWGRKKDLDVKLGYLSRDFENPWSLKFSAFVILSFMEHWPEINTSLRALHKIIEDDAVGLIEVPNFEFVIKNGLYSEFTTDHIFYFDRKTLQGVLELNGFDVLNIESVWHDYILSAQVKKRQKMIAGGFLIKQNQIVRHIDQFVSQFKKNEVVIWGAGHQALAVTALARLQLRVSHVVDSAPFKQNKYTPGTGLLIKSPDSLLYDKPKAIIIMAAAYSDEVARTILASYQNVKHVAILRENELEILKFGK